MTQFAHQMIVLKHPDVGVFSLQVFQAQVESRGDGIHCGAVRLICKLERGPATDVWCYPSLGKNHGSADPGSTLQP